ncbi:hypothetical protein [Actinosynnema mirum]|uniref:Uncharacterized protein n=1 Tax=Actinosynnema mirum (strain ATCC 29888 / DSM 43827 / JCM 3225 / NBRC 14064 / NCIMB 13271 / NRRL B-12336 / IMRU 3971 / 101) TaxID=446462 RepID=C6WB98_ACTMD|nr:hypothetical protein [Actinosynnema mirum]ACU39389.1 hypothetical protein Amir_5571 [Actinosynnema mirum DSM 43827]
MTRQLREPDHGTYRGYQLHAYRGHPKLWRSGELERCEPCVQARRQHDRERYARRCASRTPAQVEEREQRALESAYRRTAVSVVPNQVLGLLLQHLPEELFDLAAARLGDHVVDRALWWAEQESTQLVTAS